MPRKEGSFSVMDAFLVRVVNDSSLEASTKRKDYNHTKRGTKIVTIFYIQVETVLEGNELPNGADLLQFGADLLQLEDASD